MTIDQALIERICTALDPATHPLLADFRQQMSSDDWKVLTSDYRTRIRAVVEFLTSRKVLARRMTDLGVATTAAAEKWAEGYDLEDWELLHSAGDNPAGLAIINRFDQVPTTRDIDRAFAEADKATADMHTTPTREHTNRYLAAWNVAFAAAGGRTENPMREALELLDQLAARSVTEGRVVDLTDLVLDPVDPQIS